jgi:hypothetical protein
MAIESVIRRDASHKCPICGGDTELYTIALRHRDGAEPPVEVSSPHRRCADLKCKGHDDGLPADSLAGADTRSVQEKIGGHPACVAESERLGGDD